MNKLERKQGFICDMDGVIYRGEFLLPGAREFVIWLEQQGKEYLFLTQNSRRIREELEQRLKRLGIDTDAMNFTPPRSTRPVS